MKMSNMLFTSTLITGTMIAISAYSWFSAWIGLEINLMSFIPLMKKDNNKYSSEAAMKYFITQAMASSILLFAITLMMNLSMFNLKATSSIEMMINSALLMKMGAAPFHFWFPEVMSGLTWNNSFILMTWQKIAPLVLLSLNTTITMFISVIIMSSAIISGIQAFNQVCLRKVLAYSSINHLGWMIASTLHSMDIWLWYFLIYSIINFNIIHMFKMLNILYINQLSSLLSFNKKLKMLFMMNFLSLAGLPPFLGFLPKWLTIHNLIMNEFYSLTLVLVVFTLISMYVYIRISISTFSINSNESIISLHKTLSTWQTISNMISIMGLIMCAFS